MTIKKLALSAVASSLMLATVSMAATVGKAFVDSNATTIASELVIGQDYNGTSVDLNTTFNPSLSAGVQDGKIMIEFTGGRLQNVTSGMLVYNQTQGKNVRKNPTLSGTNKQKLIFDINDSINDADTLYIADTDPDSNASSHDDNASILLDVLADQKQVTMHYSLLDNTDKVLTTADAGEVLSTKQEWEVSVATKFDAQIDASQDFKQFIADSTTNTTIDKSDINIKHNPVAVGTGAVTWNVKTYMDKNITEAGTLVSAATGGTASVNPIVLASDNTLGYVVDKNITTNPASSDDYNLTFTANTTDELPETIFKTSVSALKATRNASFKKPYLNQANLGAWSIYGYKAQIPNVTGKSGFQTVLKFTNRSTLNRNIYFTLIDPDGTVATFNSKDITSLTPLNSGVTGTYKASDLMAIVKDGTNVKITETKDSTAGFDATGSFSVEVSIPTTPSKVYGFASFKNLNTTPPQFKDLPVYNTSKLAY